MPPGCPNFGYPIVQLHAYTPPSGAVLSPGGRGFGLPVTVSPVGRGNCRRQDEVPLGDKLTHDGEQVAGEVGDGAVEEVSEGPDDLPHGEVTVTRTDQRGGRGIDQAGPTQPSVLAEHDRLRIGGSGFTAGLLDDVLGALRPGRRQVG